eukprot:scaffold2865_cov628-Pavlova_lutheri.AAC.2
MAPARSSRTSAQPDSPRPGLLWLGDVVRASERRARHAHVALVRVRLGRRVAHRARRGLDARRFGTRGDGCLVRPAPRQLQLELALDDARRRHAPVLHLATSRAHVEHDRHRAAEAHHRAEQHRDCGLIVCLGANGKRAKGGDEDRWVGLGHRLPRIACGARLTVGPAFFFLEPTVEPPAA